MSAQIHVVSKKDHSKNAVVSTASRPPALAPSSVRTRTRLVGLSKNNLAYVQAGGIMGWWSAFPVPSSGLPAPYSPDEWIIAPAWGYAEVVASTTPGVPAGSFLFGFWPTSAYWHDLLLDPLEPPGHFREVSEHRKVMMNLYNRYIHVPALPAGDLAAWTCFPVWGTGYLLNRFAFPSDPSLAPIHPGGLADWTREDADLTSSVVVGLSASSKTGRSFSWNLTENRGAHNAPLAYWEVSSSSSRSPPPPTSRQTTPFPVRSIRYDELTAQAAATSAMAAQKPGRVLVVDFGARDGVVERFLDAATASLPESIVFTILAVGSRSGLVQDPELPRHMAKGQKLVRIQCNHSRIQDMAMEAVGSDSVYNDWWTALERSLGGEAMQGVKMVYRSGIEGATGIEGSWKELMAGRISSTEALVFEI